MLPCGGFSDKRASRSVRISRLPIEAPRLLIQVKVGRDVRGGCKRGDFFWGGGGWGWRKLASSHSQPRCN